MIGIGIALVVGFVIGVAYEKWQEYKFWNH